MTSTETNPGETLHAMFQHQARLTPNRVAIVSEGTSITYRELDEASDRLAAMLLRFNVKKDSCVGILMERCNEYALAYVSILKAGGAYMPLDPAYPPSLLADVLKDSSPAVVICKRNFVSRLPESQHVILLDSDWDASLTALTESDTEAIQKVDTKDDMALAYFVYSSGTTGKPKGIACPHRGAVFSYKYRYHSIPYMNDIEIEACNVFFVWEMFRPLCQGKTLLVIPDDVIYDPPTLTLFLQKFKATRMLFTPSLLEAVLDCKSIDSAAFQERLKSMQVIILCGEVVTVSLQQRVKTQLPWVHLWNLYSVSECHDVAQIELTNGEYGTRKFCPIGKIFKGVDAIVLDDSFKRKAMGEEGELYVAGPTLAREYLGLPELTASRFPTIDGVRMYKTGDRARVLPNRDLEVLGRCDSMQKIRGYSVELHAIESAIMATGMVSACCVIAQGEEGTDKSVVGYVVLVNQATCRNIRLELKKKLPHYMVPSYLVSLDELPTHAVSGKLNKKELPPVNVKTGRVESRGLRMRSFSTEVTDCTGPRNDTERKLHDIWCKIMNMHQIDVELDSFFDIGGHSLLAAQLVQAIDLEMKVSVGVVDLFAHSTIEALAAFISGKPGSQQQALDLEFEVETYHVRQEEFSDIALRAFWRTTHFAQVRARAALLTGATGFLGSYLLYELLSNADYDIVYCVVRGDKNVRERIVQSLTEKGLWKEDSFSSRLQVFAGDISLHHLGLDDDDYAFLSSHVDVVVHAAANVNLVYPYSGLRNGNVIATRNMVEFCLSSKVKRMAYVSTNGVFPDVGMTNITEDSDATEHVKLLASGYGQSKWVAEQIVRKAVDMGLPAVIFRPGNLGGDTGQHGGDKAWNLSDFNFLMLTGCINLGFAPTLDTDWLVEMTPVDFAASLMVQMIHDNSILGRTFHVTNCGQSPKAAHCIALINEAGYSIEQCTFEEWKFRLDNATDSSLSKLKSACLQTTSKSLQDLSTFDNAQFNTEVQARGQTIPCIDDHLVREYLQSWQLRKLVAIPGVDGRPLSGKVALVTGATSGIGAAIAKGLAEKGATVVIAGRRIDRLQALAQTITAQTGSVVVPYKLDVTRRDEVKSCVKFCELSQGPVDILVNNAGVMYYTLMKNLLEDQWEQTVDVNIKGVLNGIGAVLPSMLARHTGHIVNTSSDAGRKVFPGLSVYSGSKFFVEAVSQGLRTETAGSGIRVTTVQPGDCRTELKGLTTDSEAQEMYAQSSDDRNVWLDPVDVANAVVFAVTAPSHVGINEILVEPRDAPA